MPVIRTKLRPSWIALAVFLGALLAAGGASASCTMTRDAGDCLPAGCCCKAPASDSPIPVAGGSTKIRDQAPARTGAICPDARGCECRSQAPTAPGPRPGQRTTAERPDPDRDAARGWLAFEASPQWVAVPVPATAGPRRKLQLYLRNSRLLI